MYICMHIADTRSEFHQCFGMAMALSSSCSSGSFVCNTSCASAFVNDINNAHNRLVMRDSGRTATNQGQSLYVYNYCLDKLLYLYTLLVNHNRQIITDYSHHVRFIVLATAQNIHNQTKTFIYSHKILTK